MIEVVLHGYGAGVGSTGNAAATAEFTSKDRCEAAAKRIDDESMTNLSFAARHGGWLVFCAEK